MSTPGFPLSLLLFRLLSGINEQSWCREKQGNRGASQMWMRPFLLLSGVANIWRLENRLQRNISSSVPWINSLLPSQSSYTGVLLSFFLEFVCCRTPLSLSKQAWTWTPTSSHHQRLNPPMASLFMRSSVGEWIPIRCWGELKSQRFDLWMDFAIFEEAAVRRRLDLRPTMLFLVPLGDLLTRPQPHANVMFILLTDCLAIASCCRFCDRNMRGCFQRLESYCFSVNSSL